MSYSTKIVEVPIEQVTFGTRYQELNPVIVEQLKVSIEEIGLKNPITITHDGELVAGLHRLTALGELGYEKVPVIYTEVNSVKNDIEQIDENLVRQTLLFPERAQQIVRKIKLSVKALRKQDSTESEEMEAYLRDRQTYKPLIDRLKVSEKDYLNYLETVLNVDPSVLKILVKWHVKEQMKIRNATYLSLSKMPKEWQYRFVNVVREQNKNPNTAAANLEIEYNKYLTNLRVEEARRKEQEKLRKREEERLQKLAEEQAKQAELLRKREEERKKREEEAAKQRQLLLQQMKKAKEEEERKALLRKQEELERQAKQRRLEEEKRAKLERQRLEQLHKKQAEGQRRAIEAEEKRIRAEEEKKRMAKYMREYNTSPPRLEDAKTSQSVIQVIKNEKSKPKHRVIHFSETFNLSSEAEQADYRTWIDSKGDIYDAGGRNRIQDAVSKYSKVLFICFNQLDKPKVVEEIEKFGQS
ncbi:ParB N-terminal domain-containing protein [Baia soyae]|uniref:ParB-like nuclease family protein n=1 Tax=Baia soyae TaxID=1544746 RepID=A0A4R2RYV7_9BACL|nr:ParB N-terminal domain-containing protein [Baia soyae]TCP68269.1 ParB-like nuclease family protein [Baia soyae]